MPHGSTHRKRPERGAPGTGCGSLVARGPGVSAVIAKGNGALGEVTKA